MEPNYKIDPKTITPEQAYDILCGASRALSAVSYSQITGAPVNRTDILRAWDPLISLLKALKPEPRFDLNDLNPDPLLMIVPYSEYEMPDKDFMESGRSL